MRLWPLAMAVAFIAGPAVHVPVAGASSGEPQLTIQDAGVHHDLNDISCTTASHCHAVGDHGLILATRDGGTTWVPQDSGTVRDLLGVSCTGDGTTPKTHCHAVGAGGTVLATIDGGATWSHKKVPPPPSDEDLLQDVACSDRLHCYAVGWFRLETSFWRRTLATTDGGDTWIAGRVEPGVWNAVTAVGSCRAWAVGSNSAVVTTDDGGRTWRDQFSGPHTSFPDFKGVHFATPLVGYAVGWTSPTGQSGTIISTKDGGTVWRPYLDIDDPKRAVQITEANRAWEDVALADVATGLAVGKKTSIELTSDGGESWNAVFKDASELPGPSPPHLLGAAFPDPKRAFAVGTGGTIVRMDFPGATRTSSSTAAPDVDATCDPPRPPDPGSTGSTPSDGQDPGRWETIWVNSAGEEGGLGPAAARRACRSRGPHPGPGTCTLRRALEIANETGGTTIRFDREVFRSEPAPTQITVDPLAGSGRQGPLSVLADDVTIDGEPDCQTPGGRARSCTAEEIDAENLDRIRPRVWIRSARPPEFVGQDGLLQVGTGGAPVSDVTVRGLLISGAPSFAGGVEVFGTGNAVTANVLAGNSRGVTVSGNAARPHGTATIRNKVAANYLGPVPGLHLDGNRTDLLVPGAATVITGNLFRGSADAGVELSSGGSTDADRALPGIRGNVVAGNVFDQPGDFGAYDLGVGGLYRGNRLSGLDRPVHLAGANGTFVSNVIEVARGDGVDFRPTVTTRGGNRPQPATGWKVGGRGRDEANTVRDAEGAGILLPPHRGNRILANRVSGNAAGALCEEDVSVVCSTTAVNQLAASTGAVTGVVAPGALVEAFVGQPYEDGRGQGERFVGRAVAAGNGRFLIQPDGVSPGDHVAVTVTGRDGSTGPFSQAVQATDDPAPGGQAPVAPAGLSATGRDGRIALSWQPVAGAAGYEVHRFTTSGFEPSPETFRCVPTGGAGTGDTGGSGGDGTAGEAADGCLEIPGTSFADTALPEGITYHYRVVAYDAHGRRSTPSGEAAAAATATSPALQQLVVDQPGDISTCPAGTAAACTSVWEALARARQAPITASGLRAVVTFDPAVFKRPASGGPTRIAGCCLDLGDGGIVLDGDNRVWMDNPGTGGARGLMAGLTLDAEGDVIASDHNVIVGMRFSGFGTAITVSGIGNTVGQPGNGNLFEGNEVAVDLLGRHNVVTGNHMADGVFRPASAFGSGTGVLVNGHDNRIGGQAPGEGNTIIGGARDGIRLVGGASGNLIAGNRIGVGASGEPAGNRRAGLAADLGAYRNTVRANTIAHNRGPGVATGPLVPDRLEITTNSVYANGGPGIDHQPASTGCQDLFPPPPTLGEVDPAAGTLTGRTCPGARVEVFTAEPDDSGAGQGRTLLATATAGGDGAFAVEDLTLGPDQVLTATATLEGATSAFAANLDVPDVVGPDRVTDLAATALSGSEIVLSFSAPGSNGGEPPPAGQFVVKQARQPITASRFEEAFTLCGGVCELTPTEVGQTLRISVGDLDPETTYHYALKARDAAGNLGPVSNTASATTTDVTPGAITDLTATATGNDTVELSFSAPGENGQLPPPATRYDVRQAHTPVTDAQSFGQARALCGEEPCTLVPAAVGDTLTLTITDLAPGTTYHYAVRAHDAAGNAGPISNPASATTPGATTAGAPGGVTRLAGQDRIATAVAASQDTFGRWEADAAVLARADLFADALAGTPLALAADGPLLLTPTTRLDPQTAAELDRAVEPGSTVYLLGGMAALDASVEDRVRDLGFLPKRLAGPNRYATAVAVAEEGLGGPSDVLLASGGDFPDAVVAGAAAAHTGAAVLLTDGETLPQATAGYLDRHPGGTRHAVGGPASRAAPDATPVMGTTRYGTAVAVAKAFFTDPAAVGVATGQSFPDSLGGGAHIARQGGPVLLSLPDRLPPEVATYLSGNAAAIGRAFLYGGPAALTDDVAAEVAGAIR